MQLWANVQAKREMMIPPPGNTEPYPITDEINAILQDLETGRYALGYDVLIKEKLLDLNEYLGPILSRTLQFGVAVRKQILGNYFPYFIHLIGELSEKNTKLETTIYDLTSLVNG